MNIRQNRWHVFAAVLFFVILISLDSSQKPKGKCAESESCPDGQFSYYIKAGAGKDDHPTVCFNGQ